MTTAETILLGIIQGLTEFLPVSSSGHLVLFQNLLGFKEPELLLDAALHAGTLLAVCLYFRSDILLMVKEVWAYLMQAPKARQAAGSTEPRPHLHLAMAVFIGSIPTAFIGLLFKVPLERLFGSVPLVGTMLIVTGLILASTRFLSPRGARDRVGLFVALAVGTAQGLAIIPGISRSGATIVCGLALGLQRDLAGRFSFLLSIPAIMGALWIQLNAEAFGRVGLAPLFFGFLSAALVGLLALKLLMGMVKKGHLYYFAPYCWAVGIAVIAIAR
jgi:undecaprenyl-diphosphatase